MLYDKKIKLVETKMTDMPTVEILESDTSYYLYSKYDPTRDSLAFAHEVFDENINCYVIYGLGLGYHINFLKDLLLDNNMEYSIYIVEFNKDIFKLFEQCKFSSNIINDKNIKIILIDENKSSYLKISNLLNRENIKIGIHRPSLKAIPNTLNEFKYLLEEYDIKNNSINKFKNMLRLNFEENIKMSAENADKLFNKYINKPIYIVSAGPSLDKNVSELSRIKDNGIILCVARATRTLLKFNIKPDYIVVTDGHSVIYNKQLDGLNIDCPIIALSTCDKNILQKYGGNKYIAFQKGYDLAEEYAKLNKSRLINTGGSVATMALDMAIKMGGNPIVFVGQDLAFTDKKTHSKETNSKNMVESNSLRTIEDIYGNEIKTSVNLYSYLRWIQNRIEEEKNIEFIDATEGGAKIRGTKIQKLEDTIDNIEKYK